MDWLKAFPLTADAFADNAEEVTADIELGDTQTRVAFNLAKISSAADRNRVDAITCAQVLRSLGMRPAAETADALAPWLAKVEAALASVAGTPMVAAGCIPIVFSVVMGAPIRRFIQSTLGGIGGKVRDASAAAVIQTMVHGDAIEAIRDAHSRLYTIKISSLEEKDLRVDTYRASGAGGQHVNTTDSAIRITHIPTNIVVQCQSDRSQHRNRATALNMLKARIYELELQKREQAAMDDNATKSDIGWGSQIRSYVLHPYQMVKDLRTNVETGNSQAVLDGALDDFIEASLAARVGSTRA